MPSCRVTNKTGKPLNICLKQVTALHFENEVKPGDEIKFRPGKVWFTLEAKVDDGTKASRYSVTKSAATIGLLSLAVGAVAVTAGAALLPATATAGAAAGAGAAASAASKASMVSKAGLATKAVIAKNAGTIAKISSVAIPKAVEKISAEVGGLTALQREVVSIISSPNLPSNVRHNATDILHKLHTAYTNDKTGPKEPVNPQSTPVTPVDPSSGSPAPRKLSSWNPFSRNSPQPRPPANTALATEAAVLDSQLPPTTNAENLVETLPVSTDEVLRVHGIYMDRRRRFEIRINGQGKLELWDANEGAIWSRTKEREHDEKLKKELKAQEKERKKSIKRGKTEKLEGNATETSATSGTDEDVPAVPPMPPGSTVTSQGVPGQAPLPMSGPPLYQAQPQNSAYGDGLGNRHGHGHGSVTSVELNREDMETAFVREGGSRRQGTIKDRLKALVDGKSNTPATNESSAAATALGSEPINQLPPAAIGPAGQTPNSGPPGIPNDFVGAGQSAAAPPLPPRHP